MKNICSQKATLRTIILRTAQPCTLKSDPYPHFTVHSNRNNPINIKINDNNNNKITPDFQMIDSCHMSNKRAGTTSLSYYSNVPFDL